MPKTILQQIYKKPDPEPIKRLIRAQMAAERLRVTDLPGGSKTSWYRWLDDPGEMQVKNLAQLIGQLHMTQDQKIQLVVDLIETYKREQR